jgi:glutamate synthase (NADPH/NADH) large chain
MCLGANRIGFGTLPMIALGCTMCRRCHAGKCPRGITARTDTSSNGADSHSLDNFERSVDRLVTLFEALGHEMERMAARMGISRLQDLVGRSDLLQQTSHCQEVCLDNLLAPVGAMIHPIHRGFGLIPLRRPRNHLTTVVSNLVMEAVAAGESNVAFEDDRVTPVDRALGTHLAGALTRYCHRWDWEPGHNGVGGEAESWRPPVNGSRCQAPSEAPVERAHLRFYASSVPGNGLGAFNGDPIHTIVEGGAQDGVAKGLSGGQVVVLKGFNHDGIRIDGSVGKGLAYGATGGLVIVQGNADSRACIRLSGADVIIGGQMHVPIDDTLGFLATRANVKGFLCEYMTAGRVLVLGDPGPWIGSGMTGGVLYLRLQPEWGFDEAAIRRRIAEGAEVDLRPVADDDGHSLRELLGTYADELTSNHQEDEARETLSLLEDWERSFVKIVPIGARSASHRM